MIDNFGLANSRRQGLTFKKIVSAILPVTVKIFLLLLILPLFLVSPLLLGCGTSEPDTVRSTAAAQAAADIPKNQVERVWSERQNDSFNPDFAIGAGDVLEISAPDVDEIKDRTERVSAENTIELPVAGEIKVGGLTEQQARVAIRQALSRLIKDPQVDVFVKEYSSRQVAVIGMVNKPGLYSLNSRSNTILDMIGQAGGMNDRASQTIIFVPVPPGVVANSTETRGLIDIVGNGTDDLNAKPSETHSSSEAETAAKAEAGEGSVSSSAVIQGQTPNALTSLLREEHPISLSVASVVRGSHRDIPVRPGDVIIVPNTGNVMVQGWVRTPGAYTVTPGLTTLGAVTAAGGQMFSSSAKVLRADTDGQLVGIPVDLAKIEAGTEQDVPVQAGDVVIVERSAVGAAPYFVYSIFQKFGSGLAFTAF
jgi:polysaccharide biosynthesis/export protein